MSTEKNRETFEAELGRLDVKCVRRVYGEEAELYGLEDGDYFGLEARSGWHFWQASRASLVIDLSDLSQCFSPNDCGDWAMWLDDVRIMVQAAGLKVKL